MTLISLYTSRVVLSTLGINDFGIYSVVAGMSVMFSFINNSLYVTTQRFLTFEIGRKDSYSIKEVFTSSINCHILIAIVIILLSETIGLWVLNKMLNIPSERMFAANVIFQFSLFSCIIGVLNSPYISSIIAYEKMVFFAWTSLIDASLKLIVVFLIQLSSIDYLIFYSFLLFCCSLVKFFIDRIYCRMQFKDCRYLYKFHRDHLLSMLNFSIWTLLRSGAVIAVNQGNNILINIFGGTIASAAIGVANQVNGVVYSFMQNVQTAFNPQITKSYSNNDIGGFHLLLIRSSKFSSYILLLVIVPLLTNTHYVLELWLDKVPDFSANLCRLALFSVLIDAMMGTLNTGAMSEGHIKCYQIITSLIWIVSVPVSWVLLKSGMDFDLIIIAKIISQILTLIYCIYYLRFKVNLPAKQFVFESVIKPIAVFVFSILIVCISIDKINDEMFKLFISIITTIFTVGMFVFFWGTDKSEKKKIINYVKHKYHEKN